MVDVMLVLLIIFMVITPMLNNKVNVELPKVSARAMENASKEDAITIAVTRDGRTFLGGDQVSLSDLGTRVGNLLDAKGKDPSADKTVYLRADNRANYGKVMDAIDAVRTAGVSQLGLLTDNSIQ
jgi:biopolymer transport protein ExbD/biopolymer transport protein TolR